MGLTGGGADFSGDGVSGDGASVEKGGEGSVGASGHADVTASVAEAVGEGMFNKLIAPMAGFVVDEDGLSVKVRSETHRAWLSGRLNRGTLETAFERAVGSKPADVRWEVSPGWFGEELVAVGEDDSDAAEVDHVNGEVQAAARWEAPGGGAAGGSSSGRPSWRGGQSERFALDGFVVGESNRLAFEASRDIARRGPGEGGMSALFLHGDCGVGKTHLLNGIAHEIRRSRPGARVRCVSGEAFANEFIAAVQKGDFEPFRARYRGLDLLCVDDVHFLAGKKKTMNELLHTFDTLDLEGARVVMASDEHPKRIEKLSHKLVSRCVSGMVVRVERPDRALREQLVRRLAAKRGLSFSAEAVSVVADVCLSSVREIEGAVVRIEACVRLLGGDPGAPVGEDVVRRALGEMGRRRPAKPVRVKLIAQVVCEELGVELSELLGNSRHRLVVLARSMTAVLSRDLTTQSYPEIARAMSRRNHSTIVTAYQRTQQSIRRGEVRDAGSSLGVMHIGELRDRLREEVLRRAATME